MADNRCCQTDDLRNKNIREAVCIDTDRVYDSCADKDCIADLRVYFTDCAQEIIDTATSVRCRKCEIINCLIDVENVPFNKGFYSVDITFFFKLIIDAYTTAMNPPTTVEGLSIFSKKCILYGSEGNVKVFSSEFTADDMDEQLNCVNTNPKAKVQCVDPVVLDTKLCRPCDCCDNIAAEGITVPKRIKCCFNGNFVQPSTEKAVKVTLGLFTIVQLERDVQMLIPAYDFCVPTKECCCDTDDPCDAFKKIRFPVNEFFPPNEQDLDCAEESDLKFTNCNCGR